LFESDELIDISALQTLLRRISCIGINKNSLSNHFYEKWCDNLRFFYILSSVWNPETVITEISLIQSAGVHVFVW